MTIQEYRGIRGLVAAEVIKDDAEEYTAGEPFAVAGVAELNRTTETSSEEHYYDNGANVVIDGVGADEVTISVSAIPLAALAKITGQYYDEARGLFVEGTRKNKYFAIGYITKKTDGTEMFVWRLKGKFNIPDSVHGTENSGTDANGQELVYKGIYTNHKFTGENGEKHPEKASTVDTSVNPVDETEFFATVQTPDTVKASA